MIKLKKITALILSVLMLMAMTVAVSAETYTIVINSPDEGYTYTAYQVFKGDYDSTSGELKRIDWSTNVDTTNIYTLLAAIYDSTAESYPFTDCISAADVANVLATYDYDDAVLQSFAEVVYSVLDTSAGTASDTGVVQTDETYNYTISGLESGYYLIKTTGLPSGDNGTTGAATRYILAMTTTEDGSEADPLASKYDIPDVDKDLDKTDASIGDTITYYLTASLPTDYSSYSTYTLIFHDTPSTGITYNEGSVEVYVYTSEDAATSHSGGTQVYSGDYTVSPDTEGATAFTVTLSDTKSLTTDGTTAIATDSSSLIQVVFTATLNSDAVIGGEGNPNEVYLEYSNDMYGDGTGTTVTDKVITWTYELDVTKIDADDNTIWIEGAEFVLYRLNDNNEKEYVIVDENDKVEGWTTDADSASPLISGSDGVFKVIGLDEGTYYLEETKAPTGYNRMSDVVTVVIAAVHSTIEGVDGDTYATYADTVTWLTDDATALDELNLTLTIGDNDPEEGTGSTDTGVVSIDIQNNSGAELPSTGGIGTTIFYVVGGILVVGAVILLITRRRMGGDDK